MNILFWHTDNLCICTIFGTMTTMHFWHIDATPEMGVRYKIGGKRGRKGGWRLVVRFGAPLLPSFLLRMPPKLHGGGGRQGHPDPFLPLSFC